MTLGLIDRDQNHSDLLSGKPHFDLFNWLREHHPLLVHNTFNSACEARVRAKLNAHALTHHEPIDWRPLYDREKEEIVSRLKSERSESLERLQEECAHATVDGAMARSALALIADCYTLPVCDTREQVEIQFWAANILSQICHQQTPGADAAARLFLEIIQSYDSSNPLTLLELLKCFRYHCERGSYTAEEIAEALNSLLKKQISLNQDDQDDRVLIVLFVEIEKYPHSESLPILNVVAESHSSQEVCSAARRSIFKLSLSALAVWDSTIIDQVSSSEFRVRYLQEAFSGQADETIINRICRTCKGFPLAKDDRRSALLEKCLHLKADHLRLIACMAICQGGAAPDQILEKTIYVLSDIAVNTSNAGNSNEALFILDKAKENWPELNETVNYALEEASLRYLNLNTRQVC